MSKNYLPDKDNDLGPWVNTFTTYAGDHLAALGLTVDQLDQISGAATEYQNALAAHTAAAAAARTARQAKDLAKKSLTGSIRSLVKQLQANPNLTNTQREALGISLRDDTRTTHNPPVSSPDPRVRTIKHLGHIIGFLDSDTEKAAKPAGVDAAEVYMAIVPADAPAPADYSQYAFVGLATRSTFTLGFEPADASKRAYYLARWVNGKGQYGPFGTATSATIAA